MSSDGSSTKVLLRAQPADLAHGVPDAFMQSIPRRRSQQLVGSVLVSKCPPPAVDGVLMKAESPCGMSRTPLPQCRQLHDLGALLGAEMGALPGRPAQPLSSGPALCGAPLVGFRSVFQAAFRFSRTLMSSQ